jgi:putative phosphoesterase
MRRGGEKLLPRVPMSSIAIISDTHMPRGGRRLPAACVERLRAADLILHAGDLMTPEVLDELRGHGEVRAIHGNVDVAELRVTLPERLVLALGAVRIGMVHDAGPAKGRLARLRRAFPDADAVVFGHSHIPLHETDPAGAFQIFNPGSPTERRRSPRHTMGLARVGAGGVTFELLELD